MRGVISCDGGDTTRPELYGVITQKWVQPSVLHTLGRKTPCSLGCEGACAMWKRTVAGSLFKLTLDPPPGK